MSGYTVFTSYVLVPISGFSQAIHCNYIQSLQLNTNTPLITDINLYFQNTSDFKFLNNGYTANKIYALLQIVSGITDSGTTIIPNKANWKAFNITNQIPSYVSGQNLTALQLTSTVFKISLLGYYGTGFTGYSITYLNYPSYLSADDGKLCFGDEIYFLGNVSSEINANVYVTDISINLPLNQFNSTTNSTWDGISPVSITEIGIYDGNNNLVAIGKMNDPIPKDATIARTIVFDIDF